MLNVILKNHDFKYEVAELIKLFTSDFQFVENKSFGMVLENNLLEYNNTLISTSKYYENYELRFESSENIKIDGLSEQELKKRTKEMIKRSMFNVLKKKFNTYVPWGILTGIRPVKIVHNLLDKGMSDEYIRQNLKENYLIMDEKIDLALEIAKRERPFIYPIDENKISLYIGIPFCPTRCLYCSFVSTDIRVSGKYMDSFVDKLLLEIDKTAEVIDKMGAYVENIYIGGGTPTTLEPHHLKAIFDRLKANFDFSKIKEFTLEAGRPDTITKDKLYEAKQGGVNRISINPQTMNEQTLKRVGRKHTPDMVRKCFEMARKMGFDNINMDLIAGLPEETVDMFKYSLDEVIKLDPENITVHSMCVKRAASLRFSDAELAKANDMNEMLSYTQKHMEKTGRKPYYMYRQKNISGNLENVGYAKDGCMSTYNINIMEEKQTIIALGGGGSTKIVMDDRIERVFNFKDPLEYIRRFDEILKKKDEILDILAGEKNG